MDYYYVISLPERGYWSGTHWTPDKSRTKLYDSEPAAFTAMMEIPVGVVEVWITIFRVELTQWLTTKGAPVWVES
uniref:Uncharacterized protein n=1 Tax=viral metagenome TaxID=1070528 RepID=A0A6M3IKI0_9ZZZZ